MTWMGDVDRANLLEELIEEATKERDAASDQFDATDNLNDRETFVSWRHTVKWLESKRGQTDS